MPKINLSLLDKLNISILFLSILSAYVLIWLTPLELPITFTNDIVFIIFMLIGSCLGLFLIPNFFNFSVMRQQFYNNYGYVFFNISIIIIFSIFGAVLSYILNSLNFDLQDALFDQIDKKLGFDWISLFKILEIDWLNLILFLSYKSIMFQIIIIFLLIGHYQPKLSDLFTFLFLSTALISIIISGLMPALAAYSYYNISANMIDHLMIAAPYDHIQHILDLRSGTLRILPQASEFKGIITFPSFHAALGVIFMIMTIKMRQKGLNIIIYSNLILINILMILATPHHGGHYLIDVIGGIIITLCLYFTSNHFHKIQAS